MNLLPPGKKLILASKSPRRKALLEEMGIPFEARTKEVEEDYPENLEGAQIAEYLARKKAKAFRNEIAKNEVVLSSDTVVWCTGRSLAKARDAEEAAQMLRMLSNRSHEVITAVCLYAQHRIVVFSDKTVVHFNRLKEEDIQYYIRHFKPFDKAGAYGIQEWIGMVGIRAIEGSYFTVMGLPTHLVFERLRHF